MIIALVSLLVFFIHVIGSFGYSTRLTGIITRKLTTSLSVANFLTLFSRLCSFLMIPLLSGKIETELAAHKTFEVVPGHYFYILLAATAGCIVGIIFFKQSIRFAANCVEHYTAGKNLLMVIAASVFTFHKSKPIQLEAVPRPLTVNDFRYLALNVFINCIFTTATLAAIYSAYIIPQFRLTALSLAFLLNGLASFVFASFIDPYISLQTDEAFTGKVKTENFYYFVRKVLFSRLAGVFLSLFMFRLFTFAIVLAIKH